jgi:hydrogenase-4 membrane subunit HyfE
MTVALALVLLGMVMMINEDDIISHMMGLLLTENGIFLLVIVAVRENVLLAGLFSGSVFAYILGTVMILVYFVGELLARAPELRIERHRRLKG